MAFDGTRLLIDSERSGSAVYALALPAVPTSPAPSPATTSAARIQSAPTPAPAGNQRDYPRWVGIGAGLLTIAMIYLAFRFIGQDQRHWIRDRRRCRR